MELKKNIAVRKNTRFIIAIDEDFNNIYLRDLTTTDVKLNAEEAHEVLSQNIGALKFIVGMIETKVKLKRKSWRKYAMRKELKVIK